MKKIQYFILGALTVLFFGCSNNSDFSPTYRGEIDGGEWINNYTIGKYWGYTGEYCSKVDSINQYSYGFKKSFDEISPNPIKKVKISVWVRLDDRNKKAILVLSVNDKNKKNVYWVGHDVNPVVKEINKWYNFEVEEKLPDFESAGATIETYIFNPDKNVVYVDDFKIIFSEE